MKVGKLQAMTAEEAIKASEEIQQALKALADDVEVLGDAACCHHDRLTALEQAITIAHQAIININRRVRFLEMIHQPPSDDDEPDPPRYLH